MGPDVPYVSLFLVCCVSDRLSSNRPSSSEDIIEDIVEVTVEERLQLSLARNYVRHVDNS